MSLAFLTAEATPASHLRARSPMERLALAAGASLARVGDWNAANSYDEPTVERARLQQSVGFADRSHLVKLELQAQPQLLAQLVADAREESAQAWWCPVTPARVLVLCEPAAAEDVRAAIARAQERTPGTVTVADVTCGLAALLLAGPQARELLARFCAIDVRPAVAPAMSFRPGSVARTPGYVLVEAPERLLVLVGWALGEYLWQVVADAAARLGGGPVGAEALAHHLPARTREPASSPQGERVDA
ncbi:MAG TPA: hypothetical protein VED41_00680 [Solirubrobacteraceae bacterium]|nr:hypothetical protein [Solirubrobacteraceae bacterium]